MELGMKLNQMPRDTSGVAIASSPQAIHPKGEKLAILTSSLAAIGHKTELVRFIQLAMFRVGCCSTWLRPNFHRKSGDLTLR